MAWIERQQARSGPSDWPELRQAFIPQRRLSQAAGRRGHFNICSSRMKPQQILVSATVHRGSEPSAARDGRVQCWLCALSGSGWLTCWKPWTCRCRWQNPARPWSAWLPPRSTHQTSRMSRARWWARCYRACPAATSRAPMVEGPAEWVGAEVWGTGGEIGFTRDGSHAEMILLPADALARKPRNYLSFEQAAPSHRSRRGWAPT